MKKYLNKLFPHAIKKEFIYGESVILFVTFMILFFGPLEIYLASKDAFFFSGYDVLPITILFFAAGFFCLSVFQYILRRLNRSIWSLFCSFLFGCGIALYIQGNFILTEYGLLDGSTINWSEYKWEGVISACLFLFSIGASVFLLCKYKKHFKTVSIISLCITLVQIITLSTLLLTNGLDKAPVQKATTKNEFSFSSDKNIAVLLFDTFDSQVMEELLKSENSSEYEELLADFTYYPDTLGMYNHTDFAIPHFLTGVQTDNQTTFGEYIDFAYSNSSFLSDLNEDNWQIGLYTDILLPRVDTGLNISNWENVTLTVSSKRRLASYLYKLVGFRYLPHQLKPYCYFYSDDMMSICSIKDSDDDIFDWNNLAFYENINSIKTNSETPTFHFYHLEGTHPPFSINTNLEYVDNTTITDEGHAMMLIIDRFIQTLKEKNIYDNTAIIICADHGYYDMKQRPVFLIKEIAKEHPFTISTSTVSYSNMQDILLSLKNESNIENILNINSNTPRLFYAYDDSWLGEDSYCAPISEYITDSHAQDSSSLSKTGIILQR